MAIMMSDSARINYISKIDFSKGFQRFHIKWPLKDLTKPKESSMFETVVIGGNRNITISWTLCVVDSWRDPIYTSFGNDMHSATTIPIIYRFCLSSSTKVLFDSTNFRAMEGTDGFGPDILSSEVDAFPIDDLMLHFWIDIPNAFAIDDNIDELEEANGQNSLQKACNDVFFLDHDKIFSNVVGTISDPSSDISVIIVNKKDEELRRFHCHTVFLSSRSDVFGTMFASEKWKENCLKNGRSVRINDVSARVMETVLQYIYTSTLPDPSIDHDHLCGIIFAADKYNLPQLKNWCVVVLIIEHDSIECRIEQLILAYRHNLVQLKSVCIAHLSLNFSTSFSDYAILKEISSDLWSEIMKDMSDRQVKTAHINLSAV